jgi:hypothetical protein
MYERYVSAIISRSDMPEENRTLVLNDGNPITHVHVSPLANRRLALFLEIATGAVIEAMFNLHLVDLNCETPYGIKVTSGVDYSNVNIELKSISSLQGNTFSASYSLGEKIFGMSCYLLFSRHSLGIWKQVESHSTTDESDPMILNSTISYQDDEQHYFFTPSETACRRMQTRIKVLQLTGYLDDCKSDDFGKLLSFFDKASERDEDHGPLLKEFDASAKQLHDFMNDIENTQTKEQTDALEIANNRVKEILSYVDERNSSNILTSRFMPPPSEFLLAAIQEINGLIAQNGFVGMFSSSNKSECTINLGINTVTKPKLSEYTTSFIEYEEE